MAEKVTGAAAGTTASTAVAVMTKLVERQLFSCLAKIFLLPEAATAAAEAEEEGEKGKMYQQHVAAIVAAASSICLTGYLAVVAFA